MLNSKCDHIIPTGVLETGIKSQIHMTSVRPHGLFCHAAVTVLRQIDTGRNRKYRNRNCRRNCGRMSPMRPGFDNLAAVTITESAVTVTVREIAAAWGPCGHKIRPLRSCGTPTAWPQLKNFCRMMRPYHAAAWYGRMAAARPYGRTLNPRNIDHNKVTPGFASTDVLRF